MHRRRIHIPVEESGRSFALLPQNLSWGVPRSVESSENDVIDSVTVIEGRIQFGSVRIVLVEASEVRKTFVVITFVRYVDTVWCSLELAFQAILRLDGPTGTSNLKYQIKVS